MKSVFKTDCGQMRDHNEDNGNVIGTDKDVAFAIVVDGMGGHNAGEVASALALTTFVNQWDKDSGLTDVNDVNEWLKTTVDKANDKIYHEATANKAYKGMGTTLVAAICKGDNVVVVNVGDSRGYLLRQDGELEQITEDHSLVNELVKAGQLSKEDANYHPNKNVITKSLGTFPHTECDIQQYDWSKGDMLLLCSDGLTDMVNKEDIEKIMKQFSTLEEIGEELIKAANEAGGSDNITIALVEHDGIDDGEEE